MLHDWRHVVTRDPVGTLAQPRNVLAYWAGALLPSSQTSGWKTKPPKEPIELKNVASHLRSDSPPLFLHRFSFFRSAAVELKRAKMIILMESGALTLLTLLHSRVAPCISPAWGMPSLCLCLCCCCRRRCGCLM